jgi:hypothetical protein
VADEGISHPNPKAFFLFTDFLLQSIHILILRSFSTFSFSALSFHSIRSLCLEVRLFAAEARYEEIEATL